MQRWMPIILADENPLQMYPICQGLPKLLLPLQGQTILNILAKQIQNSGFSKAILLVRQKDHKLIQKDIQNCCITMQVYSNIKCFQLCKSIQNKNLLLMKTQHLSNMNLQSLIQYHQHQNAQITVTVQVAYKNASTWWLQNQNKQIWGRFEEIEQLGINIDYQTIYLNNSSLKRMADVGIVCITKRLINYLTIFDKQITSFDEWLDLCINKRNNKYLLEAFQLQSLKISSYQLSNKSFPFKSISDLKFLYLLTKNKYKSSYVDQTAEILSNKIINSVVMAKAKISKGCSIINCVIGVGALIKQNSALKDCRIAPGCIISKETKMTGSQITQSLETEQKIQE